MEYLDIWRLRSKVCWVSFVVARPRPSTVVTCRQESSASKWWWPSLNNVSLKFYHKPKKWKWTLISLLLLCSTVPSATKYRKTAGEKRSPYWSFNPSVWIRNTWLSDYRLLKVPGRRSVYVDSMSVTLFFSGTLIQNTKCVYLSTNTAKTSPRFYVVSTILSTLCQVLGIAYREDHCGFSALNILNGVYVLVFLSALLIKQLSHCQRLVNHVTWCR